MDSTTQQAVAQAVRVQRVRADFASEAELARNAGYSPSALSKRLSGHIRLNLDDVDVLAKALGLPDGFALMEVARGEREHVA